MSNANWNPLSGNFWRLAITADAGPTVAFLSVSFPGDGGSLTADDSAGLLAGLVSAVAALDGVTGCAATPVSVNAEALNEYNAAFVTVVLDAADWACYAGLLFQPDILSGIDFTPSFSAVTLFTRSPADGILSQADTDGLAAGLLAAGETLAGVEGGSMVQAVTTPSPI